MMYCYIKQGLLNSLRNMYVKTVLLAMICSGAATKAYFCLDPGFVTNSERIFQRQRRLVQFVCNQNYQPLGSPLLSCVNGIWRGTKPVCTAPGCPPLETLRNGIESSELDGGVLKYSCNSGYKLIGHSVLYCDGTRWNASRPVCINARQTPESHYTLPNLDHNHQSSQRAALNETYRNESAENKSSYVDWPRRYVLPLYMTERKEFNSKTLQQTTANNEHIANKLFPSAYPSRATSKEAWDKTSDSITSWASSTRESLHNATNSTSNLFNYNNARIVLKGLISSRESFQGDQHKGNGTDVLQQLELQDDILINRTSQKPSTPRRISCPSPPRPRRGFHITRPLPQDYFDDEYVYYIEYHCLPGFTMVSGDNTSYCLKSGKWSGQVPVCEDAQGCVTGFKRTMSGTCEDIDECARNNGGCPHICTNTLGSFICGCRYGFHLSEDAVSCIDINECETSVPRCSHICVNTYGSFQCSCSPGFFQINHGDRTCIDINECLPDGRGPCQESCLNSYGSFMCICASGYEIGTDGTSCLPSCGRGFSKDWIEGAESGRCTDINECGNSNLNMCASACINTHGSYFCDCDEGFKLNEDGHTCSKAVSPISIPLNDSECNINNYEECFPCPNHSKIQIVGNKYQCNCIIGYKGNPVLQIDCTEINECDDSNYGCSHKCVNTNGGVYCECPQGFALDTDGRSCQDVDECINSGLCVNGICNNAEGFYNCTCNAGFSIDPQDPNICNAPIGSCASLHNPENGRVLPPRLCLGQQTFTAGRVCLYTCNRGYQIVGMGRRVCGAHGWNSDAPICVATALCPPIQRPSNADVIPQSCYTQRSLRWQLCVFVCENGYRLIGNITARCGPNQQWNVLPPRCIQESSNQHALPVIQCPPDIDVDLREGEANANFTIVGPVSNMNIIERRSDGHGSRNSFPAGITTVEFTAFSDDRSSNASCTVRVNVQDKEAPVIQQCPQSMTIVTLERYPNISWEEPLFSDNVGVVDIRMSRIPPGRLSWGTHRITYTAIDAAGNIAECTYAVTLKKPKCSPLKPPQHGKISCASWLKGMLCEISCDDGFELSDDSPLSYLCTGGVWALPSYTPQCLRSADRINIIVSTTNTSAENQVLRTAIPPTAHAMGRRLCSKGYINVVTSNGSYNCEPCRPGTYRPQLHLIKSCIPCPKGFYQNLPGQGFCHHCPAHNRPKGCEN